MDWTVREIVAGNKNAPIEALTKLAEDKEFIIRDRVAWNKKRPR
jgi:hypothetical protein